MFKKEEEPVSIKNAETLIGPSIKVKGNFHGQGNIIIEGIIEGSVKTNKYLLIGEKSLITASVSAQNAKIGGEVKGNIKIKDYLEITKTAKVFGDIEASSISIEKGAIINGKCTMVSSGEVKK